MGMIEKGGLFDDRLGESWESLVNVFHSLQFGQRPSQEADPYPH